MREESTRITSGIYFFEISVSDTFPSVIKNWKPSETRNLPVLKVNSVFSPKYNSFIKIPYGDFNIYFIIDLLIKI